MMNKELTYKAQKSSACGGTGEGKSMGALKDSAQNPFAQSSNFNPISNSICGKSIKENNILLGDLNYQTLKMHVANTNSKRDIYIYI